MAPRVCSLVKLLTQLLINEPTSLCVTILQFHEKEDTIKGCFDDKFLHINGKIISSLIIVQIIIHLGKPSWGKSDVFLNIVQTGGGGSTHVQKLCRKLSCVLEVI